MFLFLNLSSSMHFKKKDHVQVHVGWLVGANSAALLLIFANCIVKKNTNFPPVCKDRLIDSCWIIT